MNDFQSRVRAVVAGLRPGEIATYGEVAEEAGYAGAARAVGRVLATSDGLPWWRVTTTNGRLVPGHEQEQARRLLAEGIPVAAGRVRPRGGNVSPSSLRRSSRPGPLPGMDPARRHGERVADEEGPSTDPA